MHGEEPCFTMRLSIWKRVYLLLADSPRCWSFWAFVSRFLDSILVFLGFQRKPVFVWCFFSVVIPSRFSRTLPFRSNWLFHPAFIEDSLLFVEAYSGDVPSVVGLLYIWLQYLEWLATAYVMVGNLMVLQTCLNETPSWTTTIKAEASSGWLAKALQTANIGDLSVVLCGNSLS